MNEQNQIKLTIRLTPEEKKSFDDIICDMKAKSGNNAFLRLLNFYWEYKVLMEKTLAMQNECKQFRILKNKLGELLHDVDVL